MKKRFAGLLVILFSDTAFAQKNRDVNAAVEISAGAFLSLNKVRYKYYNYADRKKVALQVQGGFEKDGLLLGFSKNIPLTKKVILSPSIGVNFINKNNFELIDTSLKKSVPFFPLALMIKVQCIQSTALRHYITAGAGVNNLHLKLNNNYNEDGGINYSAGYNILSKKNKIGAGLLFSIQNNRASQFITHEESRYAINYHIKRQFISLFLFKRF